MLPSVPRIEALASPIEVEQTTPEPTPILKLIAHTSSNSKYDKTCGNKIHTGDIYRCSAQDFNKKNLLDSIRLETVRL